MADEVAQFIPGDTPGTIRGNYDPNSAPETDVQVHVHLIPIADYDTAAPLTAQVIFSHDRELVHAGRTDETMKTYRKVWKRWAADALASTTKIASTICTNMRSSWAGYRMTRCTR